MLAKGCKDKESITEGKREGGGRDERRTEERKTSDKQWRGIWEIHKARDDGAAVWKAEEREVKGGWGSERHADLY